MNLQHIAANWKTTVSSVLTTMMFTTAGLMAYPPVAAYAAAHPKWAAWVGGAQVVGKIWIGLIQQDAGTTTAVTPQGVQAVPSHEVPDDPNAVPVTKETK